MVENINKSDFHNRVVEVIKELSELAESAQKQDGKHRAIVILAAEEVDEKMMTNVCCINGRGKEIGSALHNFATQPASAEIFKDVATAVVFESILKKN